MKTLLELQSYVDERARRHAEAKSRTHSQFEKIENDARMNEAMEIGMYIANKIKEGGQ